MDRAARPALVRAPPVGRSSNRASNAAKVRLFRGIRPHIRAIAASEPKVPNVAGSPSRGGRALRSDGKAGQIIDKPLCIAPLTVGVCRTINNLCRTPLPRTSRTWLEAEVGSADGPGGRANPGASAAGGRTTPLLLLVRSR